MDILAAIKREERKLEKQLGKLQKQLDRCEPREKHWQFSQSRTNWHQETRSV